MAPFRSFAAPRINWLEMATKQTFAASARLGLGDGGNAQEEDFKSKMQ